jgi:DNA gyrase subunit A
MVAVREDAKLLVVTEKGMGKRTDVDEYRLQKRGGYGVINIKTTAKSGKVVAIKGVTDDDQLMVITRNGVVNRQRVDEIRIIGRATQGVRLVNLDKGDEVMDVARFLDDGEDELENELQAAVEEGVMTPEQAAELSAFGDPADFAPAVDADADDDDAAEDQADGEDEE